jgi:lipopolysaccharide export system protein LptC
MAAAAPASRWLAAAALAGLAAASWWLSRSASIPPAAPPAAARHEPDYIVENFTATVMTEQGNPHYRLTASRLVHYADDGSHELEQPYLVQYGEGAPTHTRASFGWMPADRSLIDMRGQVRVARGRDPKSAGGEIRADSMRVHLDQKPEKQKAAADERR